MTNKEIIGHLSVDLTRVALGYKSGSIKMAKTFSREVLKRKAEVNTDTVKPYVKKLLDKLDIILTQNDNQKIAEDALMYSSLFQNYSQKL